MPQGLECSDGGRRTVSIGRDPSSPESAEGYNPRHDDTQTVHKVMDIDVGRYVVEKRARRVSILATRDVIRDGSSISARVLPILMLKSISNTLYRCK